MPGKSSKFPLQKVPETKIIETDTLSVVMQNIYKCSAFICPLASIILICSFRLKTSYIDLQYIHKRSFRRFRFGLLFTCISRYQDSSNP